jgi:hypothetical protein
VTPECHGAGVQHGVGWAGRISTISGPPPDYFIGLIRETITLREEKFAIIGLQTTRFAIIGIQTLTSLKWPLKCWLLTFHDFWCFFINLLFQNTCILPLTWPFCPYAIFTYEIDTSFSVRRFVCRRSPPRPPDVASIYVIMCDICELVLVSVNSCFYMCDISIGILIYFLWDF